jgi:hypothetical protein
MIGPVALLGLMGSICWSADSAKDQEAAKKALQTLNDYIGDWNGNAETKGSKSEIWKEGMAWGWKFNKEGPPSLVIEFKDSKNFGKGEVKYLADKKKFQLTLMDKDKKEQVFEGEAKRNALTFTRIDSGTMDKYTLKMNTTNEGALFNMELAVQTGGRGLDKKLFVVQSKKEGSAIGGGKKNECIVSGGVGTRAVSFNGKTYYVCCSGCADAFNENPKKFVDEWEKKNKK